MQSQDRFFILLFPLLLLHTIFFEFSITSLYHFYTTGFSGGDWLGFYGISQTFLSGQSPPYAYSPVGRTPLYYLANSIPLKIFGDHLWAYQLGNAVLTTPLFLALYLLSKKLFTPRIATVTVILAFFNPFIFKNIIYPHSKIFTAFFVLIAIYFYLNLRESNFRSKSNILLLGISSGFAYLSHQIALVFIIGMLIDYLLMARLKITNFSIKTVGIGITSFSIITIPWYLWAINNFGLKTLLSSSPPVFKTPLSYWMYTRFHDLFTTFTPLELGYYTYKAITGQILLEKIYDSLISFYIHSVPGALTITLTMVSIYEIKTNWKKIATTLNTIRKNPEKQATSNHWCIALISITGFIGAILTHPAVFLNNHGIAMASLVPLIPLLLIYLAKHVHDSPIRGFLLAGVILEFLFTAWTQLLLANTGWKSQPTPGEKTAMAINSFIPGSEILGDYRALAIVLVIIIQAIFIILVVGLKDRESTFSSGMS